MPQSNPHKFFIDSDTLIGFLKQDYKDEEIQKLINKRFNPNNVKDQQMVICTNVLGETLKNFLDANKTNINTLSDQIIKKITEIQEKINNGYIKIISLEDVKVNDVFKAYDELNIIDNRIGIADKWNLSVFVCLADIKTFYTISEDIIDSIDIRKYLENNGKKLSEIR